jgi:hypothetical protein
MHTKDPGARSVSPVPGIVPEPVTVQHDGPAPRPSTWQRPKARTTLVGRLLGLLRGDKYMVNAYPPQWRTPTTSPAPLREDVVAEPVTAPDAQER